MIKKTSSAGLPAAQSLLSPADKLAKNSAQHAGRSAGTNTDTNADISTEINAGTGTGKNAISTMRARSAEKSRSVAKNVSQSCSRLSKNILNRAAKSAGQSVVPEPMLSASLSLPLNLPLDQVSDQSLNLSLDQVSDQSQNLSLDQCPDQSPDHTPNSPSNLCIPNQAIPKETAIPKNAAIRAEVPGGKDIAEPDQNTDASLLLAAPERIHPALWRASQIARSPGLYVSTGYPEISAQLPGGGWPLGNLIEVMTPRAGIGELQLFRHALSDQSTSGHPEGNRQHARGNGSVVADPSARDVPSADSGPRLRNAQDQRPIVLIQPPYVPQICAWAQWGVAPSRLLWLSPRGMADALWAAEHILNSGAFAALVLWQDTLRDAALRRLQLAAQKGDTLFVLVRALSAARQSSPAPLRLALQPEPTGLQVHIVKRRGSAMEHPVHVTLYSSTLTRSGPADPAPTDFLHAGHSAYPAAFTEFYDANMDSRASAASHTGHSLS